MPPVIPGQDLAWLSISPQERSFTKSVSNDLRVGLIHHGISEPMETWACAQVLKPWVHPKDLWPRSLKQYKMREVGSPEIGKSQATKPLLGSYVNYYYYMYVHIYIHCIYVRIYYNYIHTYYIHAYINMYVYNCIYIYIHTHVCAILFALRMYMCA
jgi:hypothetical protein